MSGNNQTDSIVWVNVRVKLRDLKAWEHNPRISTKKQAKRILESFDKFGQVETIAVDPLLNVLDGHQRLNALLVSFGSDYELDARQSNRALTEDERKELVISLHAGAVGSWDWQVVSGWDAPKMKDWGMDKDLLKGWNNDANNLKEMLKAQEPETVDAPADVDRAAELLEKWQVQTGDLWQIGDHRLICGDCTDAAVVARVMGGGRADCMWTDPPYGVSYTGGAKEREPIENDGDITVATQGIKLASDFIKLGGVVYLAAPAARLNEFWSLFVDAGFHYSTLLVWVKNNMAGGWGDYRGAYENIFYGWREGASHYWCGARDKSTVFNYDKPSSSDEHPTMKPVELVQEHLSNSTVLGDVVYDPFVGSGTTLVACENLSRRCRAIEISPAYVAVALERMSQAFPSLEIRRL